MTFADELLERGVPWITEEPSPGYADPTLLPGATDDAQATADFLATSTIAPAPLGALTADEIGGFVSDLEAWGNSPEALAGETELILLAFGTTECLLIGGDPGQVLTPTEVGVILGISAKAARELIAEDDAAGDLIPGIRISERRMRVLRGDLAVWMGVRLTGRGKVEQAKPAGQPVATTRAPGEPPPVRVYRRNPRKR